MSDKPKIHASLADLETEGKPEPFVFAFKNQRITFPDLFEQGWEEGERFLAEMENKSNSVVLKEWLSAEDYEKLAGAGLSLRQLGILLQKVMAHYEGRVGTPGEGGGSAN